MDVLIFLVLILSMLIFVVNNYIIDVGHAFVDHLICICSQLSDL